MPLTSRTSSRLARRPATRPTPNRWRGRSRSAMRIGRWPSGSCGAPPHVERHHAGIAVGNFTESTNGCSCAVDADADARCRLEPMRAAMPETLAGLIGATAEGASVAHRAIPLCRSCAPRSLPAARSESAAPHLPACTGHDGDKRRVVSPCRSMSSRQLQRKAPLAGAACAG